MSPAGRRTTGMPPAPPPPPPPLWALEHPTGERPSAAKTAGGQRWVHSRWRRVQTVEAGKRGLFVVSPDRPAPGPGPAPAPAPPGNLARLRLDASRSGSDWEDSCCVHGLPDICASVHPVTQSAGKWDRIREGPQIRNSTHVKVQVLA